MHAHKFESALKSRQFEKKFRREKHAGNVFLKRPRYNVWLRISWFIYFVRYAPSATNTTAYTVAISLPRYHNYSRERNYGAIHTNAYVYGQASEYIAPFFDPCATRYYISYDVRNFEIINRRCGESLREFSLSRAITLFEYFASSEHEGTLFFCDTSCALLSTVRFMKIKKEKTEKI